MCYSIPGRIVSLDKDRAVVEYFGEQRMVRVLESPSAPKVKIGDYVYAQGGIIVDALPESEALPILEAWKQRFAELRKRDRRISGGMPRKGMEEILQKAEKGQGIEAADMQEILEMRGLDTTAVLCSAANKLRAERIGNACCVHGIIEFSSHCTNDCFYCGINRNNAVLRRYRMAPEEIVSEAIRAVDELGFKALVLQSGEDPHYTDKMLVSIVKGIREKCGVLLFMSIGERSGECYRRLYEAGAYGALLRFETSNPAIYAALHSRRRLARRLSLIRKLKHMGYVLATGFLMGLPMQTNDELIKDILLAKSFRPDMFSFGPLIPHPRTPLASAQRVSPERVRMAIALARLAAPDSHIVVTTAMETLSPELKRTGLLAGANSLMINLTPQRYKSCYEIYPAKAGSEKSAEAAIKETLALLYSLGRAPTDVGAA